MRKKVFAISGSTRAASNNLKLLQLIQKLLAEKEVDMEIFNDLALLPHFNPDLDTHDPPAAIASFRQKIIAADAVLICTPEYVFSIPGSLKNALEWLVSTVIMTDKKVGIITASASGKKGHAELKMLMKVLVGKPVNKASLLISSIKSKLDAEGNIKDEATKKALEGFVNKFLKIITSE